MKRFVDERVSRAHRFSLGCDNQTDKPYLSIPVANRMVNYEEYYWLESAVYSLFLTGENAAARFAQECREQKHDDLLILQPGSDRSTAI